MLKNHSRRLVGLKGSGGVGGWQSDDGRGRDPRGRRFEFYFVSLNYKFGSNTCLNLIGPALLAGSCNASVIIELRKEHLEMRVKQKSNLHLNSQVADP